MISSHSERTATLRITPLVLLLALAPACSRQGAAAAATQEEHGHSEGKGHDEHDEHDEHDDKVEISPEQMAEAGIEVALAAPARVSETLRLPGTVSPNADTVLHVTPRVAGRLRTVEGHLGDRVHAGDLLCTLESVELGEAVADYLRDSERVDAAEETLLQERRLFEERLATLEEVLTGATVVQKGIYEREKELQAKAISTIRPLLEADKAYQLAALDKTRQLTDLRARRDARLLELEVELRTRKIDLAAAANRLVTLGVAPDRLVDEEERAALVSGEYRLHATGEGIITSRHASIGEFVEAGAQIYTIENLSDVWFIASVFEGQLAAVRSGQSARIVLDAFPDVPLTGEVHFIDYSVDPISRSLGLRITLPNPSLEVWPEEFPIRPGMFGQAEIETAGHQAAVVIPEIAIVHEDEGDFVFVEVEPTIFERRPVEARPVAGNQVEITSGLEAGESVAVRGTFLLKSAQRKGELGGEHSH